MKRRIVVDTNLWIRALLGGPVTLPVLEAWRAGKFLVLISQDLGCGGTACRLAGAEGVAMAWVVLIVAGRSGRNAPPVPKFSIFIV